jgi:cathepsin H
MTFEQLSEHFHLKENEENAEQNCSATRSSPLTASGANDVPSSWDWSDHGGVSPVKDQGSCGSCWTFSTVGCLEAAQLIQNGRLVTYSEQQLVDCAGAFDNHGCNGGLPSHAFEYLNYAGGISTEDAYPYYAVDRACTVDPSTFKLSVGHSQNITEGDEDELKTAVYKQPVSVAFQVVDDFDGYKEGVYTSTNCASGPSDVNHAVLAVGYGTDESGMDYWIVKNSWGTTWGDKGFFKIERGVNMCGIAQCNSYPDSVKTINGGFPSFI